MRTICVAALVVALTACQRQDAPQQPTPSQPDYVPTATIKDLMLSVIDPAADVVWLSVTTIQNESGIQENRPTSDEEWMKVRHGAITLLEGANLLMIPGRRVAPPGDKSVAPGVELEPEEMQVMIDQDRAAWNVRALALHDAALASLNAIDAHDADKVFELGEQIEHACEGCHRQYWYPNEEIPELPSPPGQ